MKKNVSQKSSADHCIFGYYFFTSNYYYNIGLQFSKFQTFIDYNFWYNSRRQLSMQYLKSAQSACQHTRKLSQLEGENRHPPTQ